MTGDSVDILEEQEKMQVAESLQEILDYVSQDMPY